MRKNIGVVLKWEGLLCCTSMVSVVPHSECLRMTQRLADEMRSTQTLTKSRIQCYVLLSWGLSGFNFPNLRYVSLVKTSNFTLRNKKFEPFLRRKERKNPQFSPRKRLISEFQKIASFDLQESSKVWDND